MVNLSWLPAGLMLFATIAVFVLGIILFIFLIRFIITVPTHLDRIATALEENNTKSRSTTLYSNNNVSTPDRVIEPINPNDIIGTKYSPPPKQSTPKKNIFTTDLKDLRRK